MIVRSGGFKIPEDLLKKKEEMTHKDGLGKEVTEKELAEKRQQILNDLNINYESLFHEMHSDHV